MNDYTTVPYVEFFPMMNIIKSKFNLPFYLKDVHNEYPHIFNHMVTKICSIKEIEREKCACIIEKNKLMVFDEYGNNVLEENNCSDKQSDLDAENNDKENNEMKNNVN